MKSKKNTYSSKTEYLFESDAEKAVLKEIEKELKPKLYKKIILKCTLISFLFITLTLSINYFTNNEINKINASIINLPNNVPEEKLNSYCNNLKSTNNESKNKYEILTNKANKIDSQIINNYNIVTLEDNIYSKIKLEEKTHKNYLELKENLLNRGYFINISSGFRTFEDSKRIYGKIMMEKGSDYAEKHVAKEGESEHNLGLAIDIIVSTDKNSLKTNYESEEYTYLKNICHLYGFIIRYPKEKEHITGYNYEPWHLRYVGKDLAKYLTKNNLTLEEYYEMEE